MPDDNYEAVNTPDRFELATPPKQAICYLYPYEFAFHSATNNAERHKHAIAGGKAFVFQYWPESLSDEWGVEYSTKTIPGGSHPLYQYIGGGERTISFEAVFTSEVEDNGAAKNSNIPSSRYTVDIKAAIARLESFKLPSYPKNGENGRVKPPPKLVLTFPGSNLGRYIDDVVVILKSVGWNYVSWFPSGIPRVVTASLSFSEIIQTGSKGGGSQIKFVGREIYEDSQILKKYNFNRAGT